MIETTVALLPRSRWPQITRERWYSSWAPEPVKPMLARVWPEQTPMTMTELIAALDKITQLPGWTNAWTAPVRARMDMMATGVRTPVGVRIVAPDVARLDALGAAVRNVILGTPGTKSAFYESLGAETRLTFEPDRSALERHGVDPVLVREQAAFLINGGQVGEAVHEGVSKRVRISQAVSWLPKPPHDLLRDATVRAGPKHDGQPVPLGLLGRPAFEITPAMLRAERGESVGHVYVDLSDGADVQSYVG
jgi:copper/silver efflux system protein